MHPIVIGLLWGLLIGIIIVPIGAVVFWKYKQTKMRRMIKRLLKSGEILQPMDKKDYNVEGWKDKFPVEGLPNNIKKLANVFIKEKKDEPVVELKGEPETKLEDLEVEKLDVALGEEEAIEKPVQESIEEENKNE